MGKKRSKTRRQRQLGQMPPVDRYLARRRRWRRVLVALAMLGFVALVAADRLNLLLDHRDDWQRYHDRWFGVAAVIDGDTLDIHVPDGRRRTTRVRLWGVDAPETAKPREGKPAEPFADEATEFTSTFVQGQRVRVLLQRHRQRGEFGRLLAYVERPDGQMLNRELVRAGLAEADDRFDHDWVDQFMELERAAKNSRRGMWGEH